MCIPKIGWGFGTHVCSLVEQYAELLRAIRLELSRTHLFKERHRTYTRCCTPPLRFFWDRKRIKKVIDAILHDFIVRD